MPPPREEQGRLELRTLAIASAASLAAALLTAQFWAAGTPIAAAVTPVIVAIVSELLHRPTQAIARRVTADRTAVGPPVAEERPPAPGGVRVYRSEPRRFGRVHPKLVAITALLAFVIAAAVVTLPELLAGQSIGRGDGQDELLRGSRPRSQRGQLRGGGAGAGTDDRGAVHR